MSVCLLLRMEQLGSYRTDFYEIGHLSIFLKSVAEVQFILISDRNKGQFT